MLNVANEGQSFGARRKVTKGSLRKPDNAPEDKAKERCRNNKMGHGIVVNLKYPSGGVVMASDVLIKGERWVFVGHEGEAKYTAI